MLDENVGALLDAAGLEYEVLACDDALADTERFCEHYGYSLEDSVNCIVVKAKTGEQRFAACVLLATTRLDVNRVVRKRLETRRISFASAEETRDLTGMEIGGVTPIGLPESLPVWVDARVMTRERIILGGGNRSSKLAISPRLFEHIAADIVDGLARGEADA